MPVLTNRRRLFRGTHEVKKFEAGPDEWPVAPTGPFAPDQLSGMLGWYDADDITTFTFSGGVAASQWRDKSTGSRHLSQANTSQQPNRIAGVLNGRSVMRFDGVDDLVFASVTAGYKHMFVVAMYRTSTFVDYDGLIGGLEWLVLTGDNGSTLWYPYEPSSCTYHLNGVWAGGAPARWPAPMGGEFGVISVARNTGVWGPITFMLGQDRTITGRNWDGDVAEVIAFDRVLSDTERVMVENYLHDKWLVSSVPPPFDPATLSGSVLALDASDVLAGPVTTWLDRSPKANHAVQLLAGVPVAASGYVTFTTDNVMATTNPVNVTMATPRHLFMVIRSRWVNGSFMGYGTSGNANLFDLWYFTGQGSLIWHGYGGGNDTVTGAPAMSPDVWHLVELSYDGTTMRVYMDAAAPQVAAVPTLLTAASPFLFGQGRYSAASDFDMRAFYFYERVLDDAERAQVRSHLTTKWGL